MLLLMPPFDVPDAFDALTEQLPASVAVPWPSAASAMIPDQETAGLPAVQGLLAQQAGPPRAVVAVEGAAGLALTVGLDHPDAKVVLLDPRPVVPGMTVDWSLLAEMADGVPRMDELFDRLAEAERHGASAEVRSQMYLDHLQRRLLPTIENRHERRWAASKLAIIRRDGVGRSDQEPESTVVPWYENVLEVRLARRTTVVLTTPDADVSRSVAAHYRQHGIQDVVRAPLPSAWWWSAPEGAARLLAAIAS